jgi:hypothetical protein
MLMRWFFCALAAVVIQCGCSSQVSTQVPTSQAPPVDKEAATVGLVEKLGDKIKRDDKQPGNPVVEVDLSYCQTVTDAEVARLKKLKQLTVLHLFKTKVTDEGLKELKELKQLTVLGLGGTNVSDEGLTELKELKQLTKLFLNGCKEVTDAGVKELKEALPKCEIRHF